MSGLEIEKDLARLKRQVTGFYSKGDYESALECALTLETRVSSIMGKKNVVYASCLNNIALMHKSLGNTTDSMDAYTEALHLYEDLVGKKHSSYAASLSNIGVLFKTMATTTKGMFMYSVVKQTCSSSLRKLGRGK
jgi:tetratricopeptide (TPR) repeat protein